LSLGIGLQIAALLKGGGTSLASYSSHIKRDHPQAEIEVKKYIGRAKGAYDRGLARDPMPREYLFSVVSERFGMDPSAVPAK